MTPIASAGTASAAAVTGADALTVEQRVLVETAPSSDGGTSLLTSGLARPGSNVPSDESEAPPAGQAARVGFAPTEQANATQSPSTAGIAAPR